MNALHIGRKTTACIRGDLLDIRRHATGFLKVPPGIAISCETIERATAAGVTRIQVANLDTGTIYRVSMADFIAHSWIDQRGNFERQHFSTFAIYTAEVKIDSKTPKAGEVVYRKLNKTRVKNNPSVSRQSARQEMFKLFRQ